MKKLLKSLAICGALFMMASCSSKAAEDSKEPADQIVSVLDKATEDLKKASSSEDVLKIYEATMTKMSEIAEKAGEDYEPSEADLAKVEKAFEAFQEACDKF